MPRRLYILAAAGFGAAIVFEMYLSYTERKLAEVELVFEIEEFLKSRSPK